MTNREIKFKAWDKLNKKMLSHREVIEGVNELNGSFEHYNEEYPVLQYTGFKDNNNKKIYEGDLIEYYKTGDIIRFSEIWFSQNCGSWYTQAGSLCNLLHEQKIEDIVYIKKVGNIFEDKKIIKEMGGLWKDKLKK